MGSDTLTEAKARIYITWIYMDGGYINPADFDNIITILNAEKINARTYLIDLGTIQPDHTRKVLLNVWGSGPMAFGFGLSVWYLA
jgi:hypothetical protein